MVGLEQSIFWFDYIQNMSMLVDRILVHCLKARCCERSCWPFLVWSGSFQLLERLYLVGMNHLWVGNVNRLRWQPLYAPFRQRFRFIWSNFVFFPICGPDKFTCRWGTLLFVQLFDLDEIQMRADGFFVSPFISFVVPFRHLLYTSCMVWVVYWVFFCSINIFCAFTCQ